MSILYWITTTPNHESDCIGYPSAPNFFLTREGQQDAILKELAFQFDVEEWEDLDPNDDARITYGKDGFIEQVEFAYDTWLAGAIDTVTGKAVVA